MTVPALLFVDRWGRRPTLLIGAALMMTWLFANAGLMATYGSYVPGGVQNKPEASWQVTGPASKAVIACTYLFVASYAPTWGPVSWIYPPELYPLRVRGKAVALATSANWAFNFALDCWEQEMITLKYLSSISAVAFVPTKRFGVGLTRAGSRTMALSLLFATSL